MNITISTNIDEIILQLNAKIPQEPASIDQLLRGIATGLHEKVKKRIHTDGQDAEGNQIGEYSDGYLVVRSGAFKNAKRTKKGKLKDAGIQTKKGVRTPFGKSKIAFIDITDEGKERIRYNRGTDPKVILSLTSQMELDFQVIPTDKGYGLGFENPFNRQKADWNETTYKRNIFALTPTEKEFISEYVKEYIESQ